MSTFKEELQKSIDKGYSIRTKLIHCDPNEKATRIANTCFISASNYLNKVIETLPTLKVLPQSEIMKIQEQLWEELKGCNEMLSATAFNIRDIKEDSEYDNTPEKNILTKEEYEELKSLAK